MKIVTFGEIMLRLAPPGFQRLTQALGAYGNLSLHKGKEVYRDYIPYALKLLLQVLDNEGAYPCLKNIVYECYQRTTE